MYTPLIIALIVFATILAGAFAGWVLRQRLPKHHLSDETKSLVSVSMAVVATASALVLGLLISNANTSFSTLGGEVTTLSAQDPETYGLLQQLEDSILALKPASARDKWWVDQAMTLAGKIGDTRWLLTQQAGQGTPKAFLALLVFWLTLLFASFGLFAPHNLTSAVTLTLCALAVAGAFGMILELERGFGGLIHISPQPLHQAIHKLQTGLVAEAYE
jgi:hypothetical protein